MIGASMDDGDSEADDPAGEEIDGVSANLHSGSAGNSMDLVRRAQGGDRESYERLFARYFPRVLAIVRARLGAKLRTRIESVDLAQAAMVQAIQSLPNFEPREDAHLIGWFAAIVENRIRDARRRAEVRAPEFAAVVDHVSDSIASDRLRIDPDSPESRPLSKVLRSEEAERLVQALQALPEAQRELVLRRVLQGESWQEISTALEYSSPDAARMAYARARVALGKLYGKDASS